MQERAAAMFVFNLLGTFVFGLSGGFLAVRKRLDLFGVMVLAAAAALGGGVMRDVLLGRTPPQTLSDWRYLAAAAAAGLLVFLQYSRVESFSASIKALDAAGLGLFTVTGTSAALNAGMAPVPAALMGMLTGVGGGALRDVLAQQVPMVLRGEIYAMAALLGALIVIAARRADLPTIPCDILAAGATFALRMISLWRNWSLPRAAASD